MQKIILATENLDKLREMQQIFAKYCARYSFLAQTDFNIVSPEETGLTFVENAILKARYASKIAELPAIADDSGLVVEALDGRPGIYSARYAGVKAAYSDNVQKILDELKNVPKEERRAQFYCVIVYLRFATDPAPLICYGVWDGFIATESRGENGFGYDPVFYVPTHNCTAAELAPEIKNQISHRAKALRLLVSTMK